MVYPVSNFLYNNNSYSSNKNERKWNAWDSSGDKLLLFVNLQCFDGFIGEIKQIGHEITFLKGSTLFI